MTRIIANPNYVEGTDVKRTGQYQFVEADGATPVDLVVWLEKSKANEKHPDGKPWIRLPKDNVTNRAYFSEDLFLSTQVDGSVEVEVKTAAPRILGATGVKQEIVDYLSDTEATEYTTIVDTAIVAFKAAKEDSKKKKPEEMSQVELEAYIAALQAGTKYTPASAPKSFLDMLTESDYARYNELLGIAAAAKANTPKAPRQPLTEAQKAQRAVKRQKTELSKAQALLESLRAASADYQATHTDSGSNSGDDEDYVETDEA